LNQNALGAPPLHSQLSAQLRQEIQSGGFQQGDPFTTEQELMRRFVLSCTTVRRALQTLVQEGYLHRKPGKGTFVRHPKIEEQLGPVSSFFEETRAKGLRPSSVVLALEKCSADASVAEKLHVSEGDRVYRLKKLQLVDGEVMAIFDSHWIMEVGERLAKYDLSRRGVFEVVEGDLGLQLGEADAAVEARNASAEEARLLGIKRGAAVLIMEHVIYLVDGRPIDFSRHIYRADKYKYRIRQMRTSRRLLRLFDNSKQVEGDAD